MTSACRARPAAASMRTGHASQWSWPDRKSETFYRASLTYAITSTYAEPDRNVVIALKWKVNT